jgi:hypothetical protein
MKSDIIDIAVQVHHATERAVLVSDDGDRDNAVWLPLSQVEIERGDRGQAVVTLPEWLAKERGLV